MAHTAQCRIQRRSAPLTAEPVERAESAMLISVAINDARLYAHRTASARAGRPKLATDQQGAGCNVEPASATWISPPVPATPRRRNTHLHHAAIVDGQRSFVQAHRQTS